MRCGRRAPGSRSGVSATGRHVVYGADATAIRHHEPLARWRSSKTTSARCASTSNPEGRARHGLTQVRRTPPPASILIKLRDLGHRRALSVAACAETWPPFRAAAAMQPAISDSRCWQGVRPPGIARDRGRRDPSAARARCASACMPSASWFDRLDDRGAVPVQERSSPSPRAVSSPARSSKWARASRVSPSAIASSPAVATAAAPSRSSCPPRACGRCPRACA